MVLSKITLNICTCTVVILVCRVHSNNLPCWALCCQHLWFWSVCHCWRSEEVYNQTNCGTWFARGHGKRVRWGNSLSSFFFFFSYYKRQMSQKFSRVCRRTPPAQLYASSTVHVGTLFWIKANKAGAQDAMTFLLLRSRWRALPRYRPLKEAKPRNLHLQVNKAYS